MEQHRKLLTSIPGPRSRELLRRRENAVPRGVFNTVPVFARAASGAIIEDVDGNRLIDFAAGLAVMNAGNAPGSVVDAMTEQATKYTHTCMHVVLNEPYVALAEKLNSLTPGSHAKKTLLVNSGAEAVENAVKIARYHTGRPGIAAFEHGFHGRTLLAMTLTAKQVYKDGFGPYPPDIHRLPYAYPYRCPAGAAPGECGPACAELAIRRLNEIGPETIACMVVEPVIGEGGFIVPASGFLPVLRKFCEDHGIVFVADEVQTGIARTGRLFGIEHEDIVPDLVVTGKALGGGLPVAGVTGRAEMMDSVHVGGLGGTFGGNPVACVAGLAVLEAISRESLVERARTIGDIALKRLREIGVRRGVVGDVRGRGAMLAVELVTDRKTKEPAKEAASAVIRGCYERGVVVLKAGSLDNVIRLIPPLTISDELLEDGLAALDEAIGAAEESQ